MQGAAALCKKTEGVCSVGFEQEFWKHTLMLNSYNNLWAGVFRTEHAKGTLLCVCHGITGIICTCVGFIPSKQNYKLTAKLKKWTEVDVKRRDQITPCWSNSPDRTWRINEDASQDLYIKAEMCLCNSSSDPERSQCACLCAVSVCVHTMDLW